MGYSFDFVSIQNVAEDRLQRAHFFHNVHTYTSVYVYVIVC